MWTACEISWKWSYRFTFSMFQSAFLRESCLVFERKRRENWIDVPRHDHVSSFPTFHPVSRRINALENKISPPPRYSWNPRRRDKLPESVDDFRFLIFRESSLRLFYTFYQPSEVFPIDPTTINPTPLLSFLENETISRNFLNDEGNENDSILIFFRENDNPLVLI